MLNQRKNNALTKSEHKCLSLQGREASKTQRGAEDALGASRNPHQKHCPTPPPPQKRKVF